jgi:hypothetical protein
MDEIAELKVRIPRALHNLADPRLRLKSGGKAERYTWTGDKYEKADEKPQ